MIAPVALLMLLTTEPSATDCAVGDHACRAERFTQLAAQTADPTTRAQRLYAAHRSYLSLHKETGDERALCKARELLSRARAIDPLPAPLVEPLRKSEVELRERATTTSTECAPRRAPRPHAKPRVDATAPPSTTPAPPIPAPAPEPVARLKAPPPTDTELLPVSADTRASTPAPRPTAPTSLPSRRPRARLGGGIGLLLAGAGLAAGTGLSLHQRTDVLRQFQRLDATIDAAGRDGTPAEYALADDLNHRYGRLTLAAGLTGAAATASVLAGVILLATPPRRRMLALPWTGGRLAGLVVRGHF